MTEIQMPENSLNDCPVKSLVFKNWTHVLSAEIIDGSVKLKVYHVDYGNYEVSIVREKKFNLAQELVVVRTEKRLLEEEIERLKKLLDEK